MLATLDAMRSRSCPLIGRLATLLTGREDATDDGALTVKNAEPSLRSEPWIMVGQVRLSVPDGETMGSRGDVGGGEASVRSLLDVSDMANSGMRTESSPRVLGGAVEREPP